MSDFGLPCYNIEVYEPLPLAWVGLGGGGILPMMAYKGRLRPKGVPYFSVQSDQSVEPR